MEQYFRAKEQFPQALVFFQLGDFFELFYEDAKIASEVIGLTLTGRGKEESGERIPMAGVPQHAAPTYVAKLLQHGYSIAICAQLADPASTKGLVPREVVRVVTPGLVLEDESLVGARANYLVAVVCEAQRSDATGLPASYALAALEFSTGQLLIGDALDAIGLAAELVRLAPSEVLIGHARESSAHDVADAFVRELLPSISIRSWTEPGSDEDPERPPAMRTVISYATAMQVGRAPSGLRVERLDRRACMELDPVAVRNLELVAPLSGERAASERENGTLVGTIDRTVTPMGARLLRRRLLRPLLDLAELARRHDAVEALVGADTVRETLRGALDGAGDLERATTRVTLGNPSIADVARIARAIRRIDAARDAVGALPACVAKLDPALDVAEDIERTLVVSDSRSAADTLAENIREGVNHRLDTLRAVTADKRGVLLAIEERERSATGIASLRIRYTRVFGYYIELTRSHVARAPSHYRRKQTVAQGERFTTNELDALQVELETADAEIDSLGKQEFERLRQRVASHVVRLRDLAAFAAELDVHASFAELARTQGYVRPLLDTSSVLELVDSRHPVVERMLARGTFVPNDLTVSGVDIHTSHPSLLLITGPNMAGKSTVMRQVALSVVLAQSGGFVPAKRARIGLVDRLFTRVGASDDLSRGQSTFMVEMTEAAVIARHATPRSLVILDEIGRGTSTYDGLSIAWALAEHLAVAVGCRTLFATHYHELAKLEDSLPQVANYNVSAAEQGGRMVFLHRLVRGAASKSYGIAVAAMAGLPAPLLERASLLLSRLEESRPVAAMAGREQAVRSADDSFANDLVREIAALDPSVLRPVDAIVVLDRLVGMARAGFDIRASAVRATADTMRQ